MNLKYKNLYNTNMKNEIKMMYKENTNVFVYYILKTLFFYFDIEFLLLCYNNNDNIIHFDKTISNIQRIIGFIKNHYKNKVFLEKVSVFENLVELYYNTNDEKSFLLKTNRMTVNEIII